MPGFGRRGPTGDDLAFVAHLESAVSVFKDFHPDTGVVGTFRAGQQLQGAPLVLDRVVPGHLSGVLEAEDFLQGPLRAPRTVGQFGWEVKLGVVAGQEVSQHGVGLGRAGKDLLAGIVADADRLLELSRMAQEELAEDSVQRQSVVDASELLGQLLLQDIERNSGDGD